MHNGDIDREIDALLGALGDWRIETVETYDGIVVLGQAAANRARIFKVTLVHARNASVYGEAPTFGAALENAVDVVAWMANQ